MITTLWVLVVITIYPNGTYTGKTTEYKSMQECIDAHVAIEVTTGAFAKCIEKQERID